MPQCKAYLTVYDEAISEIENAVKPGRTFEQLPADYTCITCEESKNGFKKIAFTALKTNAL